MAAQLRYNGLYLLFAGFPQQLAASAADAFAQFNHSKHNPDKLTNYEIGSKGKLLGGLLTYDASVYYIKWKGFSSS